VEFDWNIQGLMKFEHEAPDYTMADKLMKGSSDFKFVSFSIYLKNLIWIGLKFDFGLLRIELINSFDFWLRL
jgi:hypothetical protein